MYAVRGDADRAFEWLEKAFDYRDAGIAEVQGLPFFRKLHGDPRWSAFLKKLGFED